MGVYYNQLEKIFEEIFCLENILNLLNWDIACNMPGGAQKSRTQEMMTLTKMIKNILISSQTQDLLTHSQQYEKDTLDDWQKANLHEMAARIQDEKIIPEKLANDLLFAANQAEWIWRQAKENNNYELFKPYLQKVLDYTKKIASLRAEKLGLSLYDALIFQYDYGMTANNIKKNFKILKDKLPILIKAIMKKQQETNWLKQPIDMNLKQQKELNQHIMKQIGFDFTHGRLDESMHPFCGGTPFDIRLTTHYKKTNFFHSFLGTIHETGHALYEQNLPSRYKNQPVGRARSFSFHESQSLLMEKQVGKSKMFLIYVSDFLNQKMNLKTKSFSAVNLYQQANLVKPDFIRIYADEVTYPLHVILRFEIEELLINDQISLDELPTIWNQKMQNYLGITPPNVGMGCLQDIHWSCGNFGYFPSYLNGAIIASMLMKKINKEYPHIQSDLQEGNLKNINAYLNNNFRNWGCFYENKDLLFHATGETEIQPEVFLEYLTHKYLRY